MPKTQTQKNSFLRVLFEDEWFVAAYKPAGLLSHHSPSEKEHNAQSILEKERGKQLTLFHRLDQETAGVLLFGKKRSINKVMGELFEKRKIKKTYWAEVEGVWPAKVKKIKSFIRKKSPGVFGSYKSGEPSESAETDFQILKVGDGYTELEIRPKTGRQHQIRVHCSAGGHPIKGDFRYGAKKSGGLALLARRLEFEHPITKKWLCVEADD
jgi:RluA family pseudouridine synthase